jgi:hypothetical protein
MAVRDVVLRIYRLWNFMLGGEAVNRGLYLRGAPGLVWRVTALGTRHYMGGSSTITQLL